MKKIIITLLFAGSAIFSYSQSQFAVGIKAGPNFANIDTDASVGEIYDSRTGWHAGGFVLIKGEKFGFQPEVLFSQQGSKFKVSGNSKTLKQEFSYVNIPLLFKFYTIAGLHLQAGPQIGFLTSAKREDLLGGDQDVKDRLKKTDVSLALGVGWDLPFGLTVDGRYNWGLTDNDDNYVTDSGAPVGQVKNQVWQVSVGYKLFRSN